MIVYGFAFYLTLAVVLSGILALLHKFVWSKWAATPRWLQVIGDYGRSFFPVLLVVLVIRSFVAQLYHVPTGSLEPTVMPGDLMLVSQYSYGLHLPITNTRIAGVGRPQRGDIVLFYYPPNPNREILVKRMIGLPGDHVVYRDKALYINGKQAQQDYVTSTIDYGHTQGYMRVVDQYQENLLGFKHAIWLQPNGGELQDIDVIVPPHQYFVLGDNRDNSGDSREWGFVPEKNLIGKARFIVASWDPINHRVRWHRFIKKLYH